MPTTAFANNTGAGDDYAPSCMFDFGGEDVVLTWTAPAAGTYLFTTSRPGTTASIGVAVLDGDCEGPELACSLEPFFPFLTGITSATLAADQTVAVVLDGFSSTDVGPIELYIDVFPDAQDGGSCCNATGMGGCDTEPIEDCVCAINPECCDGTWGSGCGQLAFQHCNAQCSCWEYPTCPAPHDDCVCMGCLVDGICDTNDDCIDCPDCAGSPLCGCNNDDVCDPYGESCGCPDCADESVCD